MARLSLRAAVSPLARTRLILAAELAAIVVWAVFFTRPYQTFDDTLNPVGREYLSAILTHHTWTWAQQCGTCALWNGAQAGGAPTLGDPYGSMLHPLVAITTLLWGVRNGAKMALVAIFIAGGLAQWWLARALGLGSLARTWSGLMAVVAGHLGARAENGNFGLLLSTVACTLVLPPVLLLLRGAGQRTAVLAGVLAALAIVSGQGYMQIALACMLPLLLFMLPADKQARRRVLGRLLLAAGLALLLAGVFLVPFLHFLPEFQKFTDPEFKAATLVSLMPLHLVINDAGFYYTDALNKLPYPYLYANFIGWVPVLLVLWALYAATSAQRRVIWLLLAGAAVVLAVASGQPLKLLASALPPLAEQFTGIRFHPIMAGMAVPPLLAIAAVGVDRIVALRDVQLHLALSQPNEEPRGIAFEPRVLVVVPLLLALLQGYAFNKNWVAVVPLQAEVGPVLDALRTPDAQWINPPFGEHFFIEPAIERGMKLSFGFRTWRWRDYSEPMPLLEADRKGVRDGMFTQNAVGDILINASAPGNEYAVLIMPNLERSLCTAQALGGNIDVTCGDSPGGTLTVKEHRWSGWNARVDGKPAALLPGQWLALDLPPGQHQIVLRYQPWDVGLGALLTLLGMLLAALLWWRAERPARHTVASPQTEPPAEATE